MLRKVVDFANVTVAVLTGLYLFLLTIAGTDGLKAVPESMVETTGSVLFFFVVGFGLVAANVALLVKDYKAGGFRRNLRVSSDQGMNEFSVSALETLILRDLKLEPDISDPQVTMTPKGEGKPIDCYVELKLRRQEDVVKRMDAIKRKIVEIIDRLIPGGLTLDVLVEVRDFFSDPPRSSGREAVVESGEFNGPVYADVVNGGSESV